MSLPSNPKACGPTVHQACGKNLYMKGYCFLLDQNLQQLQKIPETLPECPSLDIVFLIDGSGSINSGDFRTMKTFISEVMKRFRNTDTQFALWQFSDRFKEHFNFNQFQTLRNPDDLLRGVSQLSGLTHTATAIQKVVKELFVPSKGSRHNAAKVLIVVTDGEKYGDPMSYQEATAEADKAGIIRYAIGVGNAFSSSVAKQELNDIASNPNHVFQVNDFNALRGIQDKLQEKIFAIEGTQSQNSSSFQLEMSQEGFSALLSPDSFVLGAVGAYDWSGGIFLNGISRTPTFLNASSANTDMKDAYLGYSVEAFSVQRKSGYVVGAPRYQHVGKVIVFTQDPRSGEWEPSGEPPQIGSYFGATLCAVDLDRDTNTDLILIGAPMYHSEGAGGRVYVCPLASHRELSSCNTVLQGQTGQLLGRFGTSMAQMGDISGDRWTDVVIGAPLESDNQGAVYVFQGTQRSINPQYSQRIVGSQFPSGLRFFGQAVSGGTDLTGDGLTDVAVGAQGQPKPRNRGKPPDLIPLPCSPCPLSLLCAGDGIRSTLRYTLTLDPGRPKSRAAFNSNSPSESKEIQIGIEMKCETFQIILPVSPGLRHHLSGLGHHLSGLGEYCSISSLRRQQPLEFTIKGNVSFSHNKADLVSKLQRKKKWGLVSSSRQGSWIASPLQVQTVVERIEVYNYLPMIIGASVGGLILLALITAALYKLGFFKRQYKQMMEKPVDEDTGGDGASQTCNTPNQ
uniref:VWFA domain-containing protein n=1 Tax=Sphenodon punctatus TaxID=8508 RepID=A0A8D0GUH4_SPHPU